ncbi:Rom2p, partial [Paramicrosporidium saccamoebae]
VFYQACENILTSAERSVIFQNLDELLLRAGLLLSDLKCRQAQEKGIVSSVSDLYLAHLKDFSCFRKYCMGHEEASKMLRQKLDSNSRFSKLVRILHFTDRTQSDHQVTLEAVQASEAFLQDVNESVRLHQSQARLGSLQSQILVQLDGDVSFVFLIPNDFDRTTLDLN